LGGDRIPARRAQHARIASGAAATAALAAVAGYPIIAGSRHPAVVALAVAAAGLLVVALVLRLEAVLLGTVAVLGTEYALYVVPKHTLDLYAPLVAAGLVAVMALGHTSISAAALVVERAALARWSAEAVALAAGSAAVGGFLLATSQVRVAGGVAVLAIGVGAAIGLVGLAAWLARGRWV
jgi:hypothetical protein